MTVKCCVCGKEFTCVYEKECIHVDPHVCWCYRHKPSKEKLCTDVKNDPEVVLFT